MKSSWSHCHAGITERKGRFYFDVGIEYDTLFSIEIDELQVAQILLRGAEADLRSAAAPPVPQEKP
jgi:hypothetical protein